MNRDKRKWDIICVKGRIGIVIEGYCNKCGGQIVRYSD